MSLPPHRVIIMHEEAQTMELVLAGIDDYRRTHPDWIIRQQYLQPTAAAETKELLSWKADGWLTVGPTTVSIPPGTPWVSIRSQQAPVNVSFAEEHIGAQAAEHLIALKPQTAFVLDLACDPHHPSWLTERMNGCRASFDLQPIPLTSLAWPSKQPGAELAAELAKKIMSAPPPRVLFALSDRLAIEVVECLIGAGIRVPADIAVIGADGLPRCADFEICISSVAVPHQAAGLLAAEMLGQLLHGITPSPTAHRLSPGGVLARASTNALAMSDPEVAAVLEAIAAHAAGSYSVEDAIAASSLSRRTIEQRFRNELGRSILDEIHRARVEHACKLLADPQRLIASIAEECGFKDAAHFTLVFRKATGITPSNWRKEHK